MVTVRPMAVEYDSNYQFVTIRCDKCGKVSPPTEELIINKGLIGMGWFCAGGKHVCPDCKEPAK